MAKELVHETKSKAFWSGRVTAWCGATAKAGEYSTTWFASVTCPGCKAARKARKAGKK
ncbi:hypothetical protein ACFWY9_16555 [Amycolatopsis sp. NPDC059027]|uniref:hypothetical protein n=1 Tax=Amycolatopsis sp. NPDC059027 TaxID=3346709 RepID=UPI003670F67E